MMNPQMMNQFARLTPEAMRKQIEMMDKKMVVLIITDLAFIKKSKNARLK